MDELKAMSKERALVPFLLGMACFLVWTHSTVTAPFYARSSDSFFTFTVSTIALIITLLLIVVCSKQVERLLHTRAPFIVIPLLGVAGSALMGAGSFIADAPTITFIVGTAMTAIASGGLLSLSGEVYARFHTAKAQVMATFGAMLLSFLIYLMASALPTVLAFIIVSLLPPTAIALYRVALRHPAPPPLEFLRDEEDAGRYPFKFLAFILAFSLPLNFLNSQISNSGGGGSWIWPTVYACALLVIGAVICFEFVLRRRKIAILSACTILLITGSLLLYLFVSTANLTLTYTLMYSGYYLFVATFYSYLGMLTRIPGQQPFRIYAVGNLANTLGLIVGTGLGSIVTRLAQPWGIVFTLVIVYLLFFIGLMLLPQARRNMFTSDEAIARPTIPAYESIEESVRHQCHNVAKRYGLSGREEEILGYLVRGRNLTTIADETILSPNTIKTHVNHIYLKLDVHTREELVMRIEETPIPRVEL